MKLQLNHLTVVLFTLLLSFGAFAQFQTSYITSTTVHWTGDEDFDYDKWMANEKEYHAKVTMKNDLILASEMLEHHYTADNSEVNLIAVYPSWSAIEEAQAKTAELEKAAWPDEKAREAVLDMRSSAFSRRHSDEIYVTVPGAKFYAKRSEEPVIVYMRKTHMAFPDDGKTEEIQAMKKEYNEFVTDKNELILGYYPMRHLWGADGRDFIEMTVVKSMTDLEAVTSRNQELVKAHWPDEAKRKAFFEKGKKYFTSWHGDYLYTNVPELSKYRTSAIEQTKKLK